MRNRYYALDHGKKAAIAPGPLQSIFGILLLLFIITTAYLALVPAPDKGYTELYLVGEDGTMLHSPAVIPPGGELKFGVGVINHEYRDMAYDVRVTLELAGASGVVHEEALALAPRGKWRGIVGLKPDGAGRGKVTVQLFADGNMTAPYRECYLMIDAKEPGEDHESAAP